MDLIAEILGNHPELAIFLALAMGFFIGKFKLGSFTLGAVLGTLFAGLIIGQLNIPIAPVIKIFFFDLFLFATGFKVGPQFFQGLKKEALPQFALTLIICVSSLFTAYLVSQFMDYDIGTAAGILAGAFTESTIIGTASEAIQRLSITDIEKTQLVNNIPIAYAATYLVGTIGVVIFLPQIAPRIVRVKLHDESKKFEQGISNKNKPGIEAILSDVEFDSRAFVVENEKWAGKSIEELEKTVNGSRMIVDRIKRNGTIIEPQNDTIIEMGDMVVITTRKNFMVEKYLEIGKEIFDKDLVNCKNEQMNIIITRKKADGMTLEELAEKYGKGLILNSLIRSGQEMPFGMQTKVNRGDILNVSGKLQNIEKTAKETGFLQKQTMLTDVLMVCLGIVLGGIIGLLSVNIFGIDVTLTTSGGALVMGLFFGWLHSRRPVYGRIPEPALWLFDNLGLTVFVAAIGISSGPYLVASLQQTGFGILLAGFVVAILPHIIGLLFGRYVLKINPLILLGVLSGAGTNTAALKAIQEQAGSKYPVLGYTIPYALGNILLTAWGPVIVSMMS
jgi:putative transport protein